jgi:anti-sigma factor RsiW
MTDIVTRLHAYLASELDTSDDAARERDTMIAEAADEIERLRAKNYELASIIATRLLEKKP